MMPKSSNDATRAVLVACLLPLIAACGASGDGLAEEGALEGSEVGEIDQSLATQYFEISFLAPVGSAPAFLAGTGFVCVLSELKNSWASGKIASVVAINGQWFGSGEGRAICTRTDAFPRGADSNWTQGMSPNQVVTMDPNAMAPNAHIPAFCSEIVDRGKGYACHRNLWFGSAFTYINAISAALNGADAPGIGDGAFVLQNGSGSLSSQLWARSQASRIQVSALSVFVGVPGAGWPVQLRGYDPNGVEADGTVNSFGTYEFRVSTLSGFNNYWMAQPRLAFCGFTRISGNFENRNDLIITETTYPTTQRAYWHIRAAAPNGSAQGAARCMLYDQR